MSDVASKAAESDETANVESDTDRHETRITYDPSGRMPFPVMAVWVCAMLGLGAYLVVYYFPELSRWGRP